MIGNYSRWIIIQNTQEYSQRLSLLPEMKAYPWKRSFRTCTKLVWESLFYINLLCDINL